ncbi:MAG TPA: hypothetical protein VGW34_14745, partial [Allosphingosinicella sp.]|nr:hypothetical protein [Allosphingosinicella sp.]
MEASRAPMRWPSAPGELLEPLPARGGAGGAAAPRRRRARFSAARQQRYLAAFALTCDTTDAAAAAGVHRSAVYRHIARDKAFAAANAAALADGYQFLEAKAARELEARAARLRRCLDEATAPTAEISQDFDHQMKLLARYARPAPRRADRWRPKPMSRWERAAALDEKLARVFGQRTGQGGS